MIWVVAIGFGASVVYTVVAIVVCLRHGTTGKSACRTTGKSACPPRFVTIAKPLCGDEPGLAENLRSFTQQDYPHYEVVFGTRDPNDPAVRIARRFGPVVVEPKVIGTNLKVSNLAAMRPSMHGDIVVISDSDMRVRPEYLASVVAPFDDPAVGAVTCLYRGVACGGQRAAGGGQENAASAPVRRPLLAARCSLLAFPSLLAAAWINESFYPSVRVALVLEPLRFCLGATMAVRRDVLDEIGGFEALANQLADDYMLGNLVAERGYRVVLAPYVVDNVVYEPSFRALFEHELRWARTIRSMRPWSYASTILTMPLIWSLAMLPFGVAGLACVAVAFALRIALQAASPGRVAPWLIPLRDILTLSVYATAHLGRSVRWRDNQFRVSPGGGLEHPS